MTLKRPLREADIEDECVDIALSQGWMHAKLEKVAKDWPDHIFFGDRGIALIIEFKRGTEESRPRQKKIQRELRLLSHFVYECKSVHHFRRILKRYRPDGCQPVPWRSSPVRTGDPSD